MKIYDICVNGRENPTGSDFERLVCSWKITGASGHSLQEACVEVSKYPDFSEICYCRQGTELSGIAVPLDMKPQPCTRYYLRIRVLSDAGECAVNDNAFFETGKMETPWSGMWIGMQKEDTFHPEFRKTFSLVPGWTKARLYITGLGLFEAYVNGEQAGTDYLAPFNTDYRDGVQYCTYDVTGLLREENELRVLLGNGWYKGRLGYTGLKEVYGNRFQLIAELHVEYEDGENTVIPTDLTWEYRGSRIVESDIYDGEFQDELLWKDNENPWKPAVAAECSFVPVERYSPPLTVQEELSVKKIMHTPAGETVLDFGQNFAGYVTFSGQLKKGELLKLSFGEILQDGNFYRDNYRTAKAEFVYRSDGTRKTVRPHFTYYGFRYVKVEGPETVHAKDFRGQVLYSSMKRTGHFSSSDERLNRLYENTVWGLKSNFIDMPTDCPQRDERLGWTGDAQVFAGTASYHMDTRAFYEKYLKDLRKDQVKHGGQVAMYLPNLQPGLSCSIWGDAAVIIPMVLYRHYGDKEMLKTAYPLMKDWVDFIHSEDVKRGQKNLWDFGFQLGDWLALDGITDQSMIGATDVYYIASVYYYGSAKMLADAAENLGYDEDVVKYRELSDDIREAVLYEYFTPAGRLSVDTQTAYYIALNTDLYPSKERLMEGLRKRLKKDCYRITSGFAGAPLMCNVLAEAGLLDYAYDFLFNQEYPGWMYEVKMGATTIWERWNSVLPNGKISGTGMNSLNHYAYGTISEFLYRYAAGIQPMEPGFKKVRIKPGITSYLSWLDCSYDSAAGLYHVRWEINTDGTVSVTVEIPFDAEAEIILPDGTIQSAGTGTHEFLCSPDRDYRCRYRMTSRLEQMKQDPAVQNIAAGYCPELQDMMEQGDPEVLSQSLQELTKNRFSSLPHKQLTEAVRRILLIKRTD